MKGTWNEKDSPSNPPYGYDFWYQPRHNVLLSSEWGAPKAIWKVSNPVSALYFALLYIREVLPVEPNQDVAKSSRYKTCAS